MYSFHIHFGWDFFSGGQVREGTSNLVRHVNIGAARSLLPYLSVTGTCVCAGPREQ